MINLRSIIDKIRGVPQTRPDGRPVGSYNFRPHQGNRERVRRMTQILRLKTEAPYDTYLTVRETYERGLANLLKEKK